ncbi:Pre-mRNA-splicing factor cwc26 [Malassezia psittaci]|uniref:Pre-mRNA-splicing factor cwc26 n=1 Tax=Malassezia psittaci TaxID=1821823 RepID=A0AAF0JD43_9BASI|nr:Pre-mRNA-splicing factor cwc26 [Malassezia psittaci]
MPDPALERYLAQHYYSGPKSDAVLNKYAGESNKKKKRKKTSHATDTLVIRDDTSTWPADEEPADEADTEIAPIVSEGIELSLKRTTKSTGWNNIRKGDESTTSDTVEQSTLPSDPLEDLGQASLERPARKSIAEKEESPSLDSFAPKAGLMSGAQLRAQREARERAEQAELERDAANSLNERQEDEAQSETVYRDASGRRINLEEEQARIREEQARAKLKDAERATWNQGLVQRRERETKRQELYSMQKEGVARHANDDRMNEVMRQKTHWEDPAKGFLSVRSKARTTRPRYEGPPPPPNRFNIQPGYRWDGVDRGNGFERRLFLKINSNQRLRSEFQMWSAEDITCLSKGRLASIPIVYTKLDKMTSLALTLPLVSPLVTRVIEVKGFSSELQTQDIRSMLLSCTLGDENAYKIKWRDDTCAYLIFHHPSVAKRAYLHLLCNPNELMRRDLMKVPTSECPRLLDAPYATVRPISGAEATPLLSNTSGTHGGTGGSQQRSSRSTGERRSSNSFSSRTFSGDTSIGQRRIPSIQLPNKPNGSLENSGSAPTSTSRSDATPRSLSHSNPSSG